MKHAKEFAQVDKKYWNARPKAAVRRIASRAFFEGRPITTSHRWFNKLVLGQFSIQKRLPAFKKVEKPIFIVGTGRSGTTIFSSLISLHPDVGMLNEPKALWYSVYPHEDVIGHYAQGYAYYQLDKSHVTDSVHKAAHRLIGDYLFLTGSKRFVDKNPEMVFRISFVRAIFPDAKFVFLIRNGHTTISSIMNWSGREGVMVNGEKHDWWGVNDRKWHFLVEQIVPQSPDLMEFYDEIKQFDAHLDKAVVEWIITMREGMRQMEQHSDAMRIFRYEDVLNNTRETLTELQTFCELPFDEIFVSYSENRLNLAPVYPEVEMHPILAPIFNQVMKEIGY